MYTKKASQCEAFFLVCKSPTSYFKKNFEVPINSKSLS